MQFNPLQQESSVANLKLQACFQLSPDLLCSLDEQGRFEDLNPAWVTILGWNPAHLPHQAWIDGVHPQDRPESLAQLQACEVGEISMGENRYRHADGSYQWFSWRMTKLAAGGYYAIAQPLAEKTALAVQLRLYQQVVDSTSTGVAIADCTLPHYPIIYCNDAFEQITGYSKAEVIGKSCRFLQGIDTDSTTIEQLRVCLREQIECRVTLKNYRKDGTSFLNDLLLVPVSDEQGKLIYCIGIQTDITQQQLAEATLRKTNEALALQVENRTTALRKLNQRLLTELVGRKRAEDAYRESENRLRAIFQKAPIGICQLDLEGKIHEANPALQSMLGYSLTALNDRDFLELIHPEDQTSQRELYTDFVTGELNDYQQEIRFVRSDGQVIWGYQKISLVPSHEGQPQFAIAIITDITERKATETALHLAQFSLDRAAIASFLVRPDGRFLYINDAAALSLGYEPSELIELGIGDIDPEFSPEIWAEHWQMLKEFGSLKLESQYQTKDGMLFPVEISENYLSFQGQEYSCLFALDITDRYQALKEVRQALLKEQELHKHSSLNGHHLLSELNWDDLEEWELSSQGFY